jgi:hypothetical protein
MRDGTKKRRDFARQLIFNRRWNLDSSHEMHLGFSERLHAQDVSPSLFQPSKQNKKARGETQRKRQKALCSTVTYGQPSRNQTDAFHYHTHKLLPKRRRRISIALWPRNQSLLYTRKGAWEWVLCTRAWKSSGADGQLIGQLMSKVIFSQQQNVFKLDPNRAQI